MAWSSGFQLVVRQCRLEGTVRGVRLRGSSIKPKGI